MIHVLKVAEMDSSNYIKPVKRYKVISSIEDFILHRRFRDSYPNKFKIRKNARMDKKYRFYIKNIKLLDKIYKQNKSYIDAQEEYITNHSKDVDKEFVNFMMQAFNLNKPGMYDVIDIWRLYKYGFGSLTRYCVLINKNELKRLFAVVVQ